MLYIGLDIHSKWMTIAGIDPDTGETVQIDKVSNDAQSISQAFGDIKGPIAGVMESGTNAWAMYRVLEPYFEKLVVADAATIWNRKTDRGAKTDRRDAMRMALMLYRDEIEALYVPDERTQDLRVLVRAKVRASRWVTKLVNEMGTVLRSWGYVKEKSLLSSAGSELIAIAQLPRHSARVMQLWNELLAKAQEIEDELEKTIAEEASKDDMCQLLETMPGVGPFTALMVRAEVGDIRRFSRPEQLISYAGYAPKVFQSGEKCYYGKLRKSSNHWLRYALGLLSQRYARTSKDTSFYKSYWRTCIKQHRNTAKVVVARKALRVMYSMLRSGQAWSKEKDCAQCKFAA